ncbi:MAG: imidazoleglycerol-phosphate dehydratase HisB, partial [Firmicutes bacterium]|nr:imidazoleglycerol-phosphate dehydratase HisB [Bacillota bacterium]
MGSVEAPRRARVSRRTSETEVELELNLDGTGSHRVATGVGFFDHMLSLWAFHASFDLELRARGDLEVDAHHTVEDVGLCLGRALNEALGDRAGICRYGHAVLPMDEALVLVAADLGGRPYLAFNVPFPAARVGDFDTELVAEFFRAVTGQAGLTLHLHLLGGRNAHHICEALFKGCGRALREAVRRGGSGI